MKSRTVRSQPHNRTGKVGTQQGNRLPAILFLLISLTACAGQAPAPSPAVSVAPATQTPAPTRAPQPQNPPARQTLEPDRGSGATQSLPLDVPAHAVDVVLGRPTQRSITANVLAHEDGEGYIAYGTQRGAYTTKTPARLLAARQPVEFVIESLQPDTLYYYQLFYRAGAAGNFAPLAERSFHTQRAAGSGFTFAIQADSHLDSNSSLAVYARTLANEHSGQPDFLIDLGDTFMTDKHVPYAAALKQYLAQRYFFGLLAPSPLFLVLGNHDGEQGSRLTGSADSMTVWSARLRTQYFPNPVPDGFYTGNATQDAFVGLLQNYYAWEWGDALFVVLDPFWFTPAQRGAGDNWSWTLGVAQYQWLKQTLETSRSKYKFVFIHHLVGGIDRESRGGAEAAGFFEWGGRNLDGSFAFTAKRPGWEMPVHQLLVKHGVNAVFHGHDHLFAKQALDGIVYQEVPQPASARFGNTNSARDYGYVTGDVLGGPGYVRVTVAPSQATVDYVRTYLPQDENAQRKNGATDYRYTLNAR